MNRKCKEFTHQIGRNSLLLLGLLLQSSKHLIQVLFDRFLGVGRLCCIEIEIDNLLVLFLLQTRVEESFPLAICNSFAGKLIRSHLAAFSRR